MDLDGVRWGLTGAEAVLKLRASKPTKPKRVGRSGEVHWPKAATAPNPPCISGARSGGKRPRTPAPRRSLRRQQRRDGEEPGAEQPDHCGAPAAPAAAATTAFPVVCQRLSIPLPLCATRCMVSTIASTEPSRQPFCACPIGVASGNRASRNRDFLPLARQRSRVACVVRLPGMSAHVPSVGRSVRAGPCPVR